MFFNIVLTSKQTFLFCTKPYEFHCSAWPVFFEISAKFHDDRGTRHVIVSTRALRYRIIVCSKSQNILCFICSFNSCHYITGCTCYCLLFYRQTSLRCPSCHQFDNIFIMNAYTRNSVIVICRFFPGCFFLFTWQILR